MSEDGIVWAIVIVCLTLGLTTCGISDRWASVEQEKIRLERDKLGLK